MPSTGQNWTNVSFPVTALVAPWNQDVSDGEIGLGKLGNFVLLFIVF